MNSAVLNRKQWLEHDPEFYKNIVLMAIPAAFQQAINIGVNLMDTVMVGSLGEAALSASSLANQYYNLFYILCMGISGGSCILSAQYWGASNQKMVKETWRLAMYLAGGSAILFSILTIFFPIPIMEIYTNDTVMILEGARYLRITAFVFLFHGTSLIMVCLLRTVGVIWLGILVSGISFFVNIFFNYMFIFGKFGAPNMGIAGAALGTLLSRIAEFLITFYYLFRVQRVFSYHFHDMVGGLDRRLIRDFFRIGAAPIFSDGFTVLGDNILGIILGHMSAAVVSGQAITLAAMRFCTAFIMGLNYSASVMIGNAVGKGERESVQRKGQSFYFLALLSGAAGGILIWNSSTWIVCRYQLSKDAVEATMQMMLAMSILMIFQSIQSIMSKGVLRGGGDTGFLMFADLIFLWTVSIPLGYFSGLVWRLSPFWVFIFFKLDIVGKSILCLWRLMSGKWIHNLNYEKAET